MKSLEQELVESKAKIENLTSTKLAVDNRSVSVSLKPKTEKVYIPPFKRNNKEKANFARLDKGKNSDVNTEISKPKSKPTIREHNKYDFVPSFITSIASCFITFMHLYGFFMPSLIILMFGLISQKFILFIRFI